MLDFLYLDTVTGSTLLHQDGGSRMIVDASGLVGIPAIRGDTYDLPDDDGAAEPDAQRMSSKVFPLSGEVWGSSIELAWQEWDVVAAAFIACKDSLGTLRWQRGGGGAQRTRRVKLAGSVEPPISDGQNFVDYQATFRSPDPCAYGATTKSSSIDPTVGVISGFSIPLVFPLDLGGSSSGGFSLINEGNYRSRRVTYTLTGPWVTPTITNQATGRGLTTAVSLAAGEKLVIDCDLRTVTYQGLDASPSVDWRTGRWPLLEPGGNVIAVGGFPAGGSLLAVTFLDAFIS